MINLIENSQLELSENYFPVLVCSGRKNHGSEIKIDNQPIVLSAIQGFRPTDSIHEMDLTWKEFILAHQQDDVIPYMAYQLYAPQTYGQMYAAFGDRFYIQSAGFGIIKSTFRTPKYNITFNKGNHVNFRNYNPYGEDGYEDLNHIGLAKGQDDIVFIGGKNYHKQFIHLTQNMVNRKIVFYYGALNVNQYEYLDDGFIFIQYNPINPNPRRWHYDLATILAQGNHF